MFRQVLAFAKISESAMGLVYRALAQQFPSGSAVRMELTQLAAEEAAHARIFEALVVKDATPVVPLNIEATLIGQAAFISRCLDLLLDISDGSSEPKEILTQLVQLESRLADHLIGQISLPVGDPLAAPLRRLAEDSETHGRRLEKLLRD